MPTSTAAPAATPNPIDDDLRAFSFAYCADALSISSQTLASLAKLGKIRSIKVGKRRLIPAIELRRILREGVPQ